MPCRVPPETAYKLTPLRERNPYSFSHSIPEAGKVARGKLLFWQSESTKNRSFDLKKPGKGKMYWFWPVKNKGVCFSGKTLGIFGEIPLQIEAGSAKVSVRECGKSAESAEGRRAAVLSPARCSGAQYEVKYGACSEVQSGEATRSTGQSTAQQQRFPAEPVHKQHNGPEKHNKEMQ